MNERDNLLSLLRRQGCAFAPVSYAMCPSLAARFDAWRTAHPGELDDAHFAEPWALATGAVATLNDPSRFDAYHDKQLLASPDYEVDSWGVGHLSTPTSMHMTQMFHPLAGADSVEQLQAYPLAHYALSESIPTLSQSVRGIHAKGLASQGAMQCTIWECAWYIRGMENLMMDMLSDEPMADAIFSNVTDMALSKALAFAHAGVDILYLGDDIGMQSRIMMSEDMYTTWIKPRLAKVIQAAKAVKPDLLVAYHSCGYVEPFIPHLIEAGVDILNPVQPECMDFGTLHAQYGNQLSFHGTIGTQSTMPFGTPAQVRAEVEKNLRIAGDAGGLFAAPTHLLEPEVPVENVLAYIDACRRFHA